MKDSSHKKIFATILAIVLLAGVALLISSLKRDMMPVVNDYEPYRATLAGVEGCLPPKDPNAPNTKECRRGLKADDGTWYALDFNLMSQTQPTLIGGERIEAIGVVTPIERVSTDMWQKYDIVGIFSVTDSVKIFDHKEATYLIEGERVKLGGTTKYFGNETHGDFDANGTQDVAFVIVSQPGGSGTFYYAVAALGTAEGYSGTNAILLGDRIAPQSTESGGGVIIVNYADRKPGEPFATKPTMGISKYFVIEGDRLAEVKP